MNQPEVRAAVVGIVAVTITWLAGQVIHGSQNPIALGFVFLVSVTAASIGGTRISSAVRGHPILALSTAAIVGAAFILCIVILIQPRDLPF